MTSQMLENMLSKCDKKTRQRADMVYDIIKRGDEPNPEYITKYYIRKYEGDLGSKSISPKLSMNKNTICNSLRVIDETARIETPIVSGYVGTNGKVEAKSIKAQLIDADRVVAESVKCRVLDANLVITEQEPVIQCNMLKNTKIKIVDNLYTNEESQSDKSQVDENNKFGNDGSNDNSSGENGNNDFI